MTLTNSGYFFEMEARDEQQMIAEYEGRVLREITYQVQGQTAISYNGIKFIANKLGGIKVISVEAEYIEKPVEMWVATVVVLNEKYETQMPGAGEQPYMMDVHVLDEKKKWVKNSDGSYDMKTVPDPFSRRKAISKATRNAIRAVIPEAMIIKFLEDAKQNRVTQKTPSKQKPQRKPRPAQEPEPQPDPDEEHVIKALAVNNLGITGFMIYKYEDNIVVKSPKNIEPSTWDQYNAVMEKLNAVWDHEEKTWIVPFDE